MAFVVCHMEKYANGNLSGLQRHNQRETEHHANKDIDPSRSHLNVDLINSDPIAYPEKINGRIAEGVETNRAIRKDAVRVCGFIIGASPELFEKMTASEVRRYFQVATDFFQARYGADNVVYAQVHLDETTPHMHLGVVPITTDHKLSAKRLFNRKELQALQADLPDDLSQQGFAVQKGRSTRRHLDEAAYKKQQAEQRVLRAQEQAVQAEKALAEKTGKLTRRATQEIKLRAHQAELVQQAQTLAGKIEQGAETLGTLQQETAREKKALAQVRAAANQVRLDTYAIDRIPVEVKRTGILRNGPQIVSVRLEDWNHIKTLAKSSAAHRDEAEGSQRDFENLLRNETQLQKRYDETYQENQRLKRLIEKKDQLIQQKDRLIGQLRQAAEMLFERGREVFGRLMGYVKGRFYMGEQDVQPEEEKGFRQGRREQEEAFEASEREYKQEQRRAERYRGPEL